MLTLAMQVPKDGDAADESNDVTDETPAPSTAAASHLAPGQRSWSALKSFIHRAQYLSI